MVPALDSRSQAPHEDAIEGAVGPSRTASIFAKPHSCFFPQGRLVHAFVSVETFPLNMESNVEFSTNPLARFSLAGQAHLLEQQATKVEPLLDTVCNKGEATMWYASPNGERPCSASDSPLLLSSKRGSQQQMSSTSTSMTTAQGRGWPGGRAHS